MKNIKINYSGFIRSLFLALMLSMSIPISISQSGMVYICQGPYSKKYHYSKTCRGLSNCSTEIIPVSISKAESLGRTLCGWEK